MGRNSKKAGCGCLNFLFLIGILALGYSGLNRHSIPEQISQFFEKNSNTLQESIPISPPPASLSSTTVNQSLPTFSFPENIPTGTTINLEGSTSMVQINHAVKHSFQKTFLGTNVNISSQGSEVGIQNLLRGRTDIAALSRPLTEIEKQQGLVAIPISQDPIIIVVGINNPFRRGLTHQQVEAIFTGQLINWLEVGGENKPIKVINRPSASRTRKVFEADILKSNHWGNHPHFITLNQDSTTEILQKLNNEGISYATYSQVRDQLTVRVVPIDGLIPESNLYPYQRTLYYVYKAPISPSIEAFLGYVTSPQGQQIIEAAKFQSNPSNLAQNSPLKSPISQKSLEKKAIRGIYLGRYQVTNNADENTIRERVRYYHSQGINTIIHGVWGNGCTMYNSEVMQKNLGFKSCPNLFQNQWLDWLIDEAHKQGMEVHAYFEKGIKIDKNSPIFNQAISQNWLVPGVDKTYTGIDHYVLDVEVPEVAHFFKEIVVEFVQKYPKIDAIQWDDYLGYHAELPGQIDRTENLTKFLKTMITSMKKVNPSVSFDLCHHNPYWAKRYFAADWENWQVDRVFIQAYNEKNFQEELKYAQRYGGIAITDQQLDRVQDLIKNPKIKSILVFPLEGKPEKTAAKFNQLAVPRP